MKKVFALVMIVLFVTACSESRSEPKVEITLSAAASMTDAIEEIADLFEAAHPNVHILLNVGSSGVLQQQISQGAPVDLYVSAAEDKFEKLVSEGRIDQDFAANLLSNRLVLIRPNKGAKSISSFEELVSRHIAKVAIGTPETVPAGMYARDTLISRNLYESLQQQEKIVYTKDVRSVLTYVESGNVDAGIVYQTDAQMSDSVEIIEVAGASDHSPIVYSMGVIKDAPHQEQARMLYEFITREEAMTVFEKYGFTRAVQP